METIKFMVDDSPYACWDWELQRKNLEFLEGIDAGYFRYMAELNIANIENEDKHRAAIALRIAFSQGLEALFALLCSAVQAPQCSIGWVLSYKNFQLIRLVKKLSKGEQLYTRFKRTPVTWNDLSENIHSNIWYEKEKVRWIQKGFGKTWAWFADEFIDENFKNEYNGIKHGLRVFPGGFHLAVGPEKTSGVPAPPENMMLLGGSTFGSSCFVKEHAMSNDKINFRPRRHLRNWSPSNLANGLLLISMSIQNITSWLRIVNGVAPNKCKFENPASEEKFEEPWKETVGVTHSSFDLVIEAGNMQPFSKEEIIKSYD